jgi:hypothetical protein
MTVKEIEERENKATKGPWRDGGDPFSVISPKAGISIINSECGIENYNDADFIIHSRGDIPYLLSLIREAKRIIKDAYEDYALQSRGEMDTCKEWLEKVRK